jgi:hypothetical protein
MTLGLQCCLCELRVDASAAEPLDPCALIVVANVDRPSGEQREQTLFAHAHCLRRVLARPTDLLLNEVSTPDEVQREADSVAQALDRLIATAGNRAPSHPFFGALRSLPPGAWTDVRHLIGTDAELDEAVSVLEHAASTKVDVAWTRDGRVERPGRVYATIVFRVDHQLAHLNLPDADDRDNVDLEAV